MRTAHLSDLHTNLRSRKEEARRVLSALPDELRAQEVDLILDAGDLFEEPPTPEEEDWTARWLRALADVAPVVGVTGNHDIGCPTVPRLRLPCSETHAPRHPITIVEVPQIVHAAGAAVALLPWPRSAHLLSAMPDATKDERHHASVEGLRLILLGLRAQLGQATGPKLLVAHAHVRGARMGEHVPQRSDFNVGVEDLGSVGADFVHLGHLHEHQQWEWHDEGRNVPVLYPGSPFANTWGETEKKGYVIADWAGDRLVDWQFVPTIATPLVHLEYDYQSQEHGAGELVPYVVQPVTGAEARLRYTARADYREAAERAAKELRDRLLEEGAVRVVIEPVIQPTVRARLPEVATIADPADKLVLWLRGQEIDEQRIERLGRLARTL